MASTIGVCGMRAKASAYVACVFALAAITQLSTLRVAEAHGYMSKPKSRNKLANERSWPQQVNYCPHCLNLGGRRTSNLVYPETIQSGLSHGLCGDAPQGGAACWEGGDCPQQDHMPGGKFYTPGIGQGGLKQEAYTAGQVIDVEFVITAHHRGFIELRLCDEARVTQACLNKYAPLERVRFEDDYTYSAQPIDPAYPGRFFLNPVCAFPQNSTVGGYVMRAKFKLPDTVSCVSCVIQMWWVTANSCVPPGYTGFDFPQAWNTCGGDGGAGWYTRTQSACLGTTLAEEFWNCADVSIQASGPAPAPTTAAPTSAPTPSAPTTAPTPAPTRSPTIPAATTPSPPTSVCKVIAPTYSQCAGTGITQGDVCCSAGDVCVPINAYYSQCRPDESAAAAPIPGGGCAKTIATWGKCGGRGRSYAGTCCMPGDTCVFHDIWYSQCVPTSSISTRRRMLRSHY